MKIKKFKKDKNNIYKLYFEDDVIVSLYDDVIIKYNLLVNKEMGKKLFDEIIKYNSFLDGYYKSIKYINKKLRTEVEIEKYLEKLNVDILDIRKIIDMLYEDGYLNKELYLKAYINDQYNLTSTGPLKVKQNLVSLGYEENIILEVLDDYDWNIKLEKIIMKRIKIHSKLSINALKSKVINDIIKLGYFKEDILNFLEQCEFTDDTLNLKRELIKIKSKYVNKYDGKELEYKVINYLLKKGFNIEDIKRCYNEE